jgi:hypothetical protein
MAAHSSLTPHPSRPVPRAQAEAKTWAFLHVRRRGFRDQDNWGTLFIVDGAGSWQRLCHTYELPWLADATGQSKSRVSRVVEGEYKLQVRTDGAKGWRLELLNTHHRANIQVHRAHRSMYIQGCILPVDFVDFKNEPEGGIGPIEQLKKGEQKIQERSIALMKQIRTRYELLSKNRKGGPTIQISAVLPARHLGKATTMSA